MRTLTVEADSRRKPLAAQICRCEGGSRPVRDPDGDLLCLRCGKPLEAVSVVIAEAPEPLNLMGRALAAEAERKRQLNRNNKARWRARYQAAWRARNPDWATKERERKRKLRAQLKKEGRSTHRP